MQVSVITLIFLFFSGKFFAGAKVFSEDYFSLPSKKPRLVLGVVCCFTSDDAQIMVHGGDNLTLSRTPIQVKNVEISKAALSSSF